MLNYFDLDLDERRLDKPFAVSSKSFTPTKISNADLANEISLVCGFTHRKINLLTHFSLLWYELVLPHD